MKTTLFSLLVLLSISTFSQFQPGTFQVGGNLAYFEDRDKAEYTTNINPFAAITSEDFERTISIRPRLGYFIQEKTSIGVELGYTHRMEEVQFSSDGGEVLAENEISTNLGSIGLFARHHVSLADGLFLYLEALADVSVGSATHDSGEELNEDIFGFGLGVNPGILWMIDDSFGLELGFGVLGYQQERRRNTDLEPEPENVSRNFGLDLSSQTLEIGMQYYF